MGNGSSGCHLGTHCRVAGSTTGVAGQKASHGGHGGKDAVQDGVVYVGRGSFHHRLSTTKWKPPWTPGHNCEAREWPATYIIHVTTSTLWDALLASTSMPLLQMPSHDGKWSRSVALLQGIQAIPRGMSFPVMVHQFQICNGGGSHQQPPFLPRLVSRTG